MRISIPTLLIATIVFVIAVAACTFTVAQNELAVRMSSTGEIAQSDYEPGLHVMNPIGEQIRKFDKRVLSREIAEEKYQSNDGQQLRVSLIARWEIADVAQYCKAIGCDEDKAAEWISEAARKSFRELIAKKSATQMLEVDANEFNAEIVDKVAIVARDAGVKLIDLSVLNVSLPATYNDSRYAAMQSWFRQSAAQLRAKGDADARRMVSQADLQKNELIANAQRDAAIVRGEADAKVAAMYANASARNPEFFSFYRSMQSYRDALGRSDDVLVISPDSEFFKYFNKATAR